MSILVDELASLVRQAVGDADATREDWERALDQAFGDNGTHTAAATERTRIAPSGGPDNPPQWHISWEIDDCDQSKTPLEAAARVWFDTFGRTAAAADDACVFLVTNSSTRVVTPIDLSEYDLTAIRDAIDNPHNEVPLEDYGV